MNKRKMRKKLALLVVAVVSFSIVACGTKEIEVTEDEQDIVEKLQNGEEVEGFEPNNGELEKVEEEVIDTANLEKYYDVTKYVGTPRLVKDVWVAQSADKTVTTLSGDRVLVSIPYDDRLVDFEEYDCIVVDNNTEEYLDDIVVYIFTE